MNKKKFKVGGLFSGVGGIELGFKKSGFEETATIYSSSVSSAQSSIQSAMVGTSQLFQGQMDSYLKSKAAAITPLMDAYADRVLVIKLKSTVLKE